MKEEKKWLENFDWVESNYYRRQFISTNFTANEAHWKWIYQLLRLPQPQHQKKNIKILYKKKIFTRELNFVTNSWT